MLCTTVVNKVHVTGKTTLSLFAIDIAHTFLPVVSGLSSWPIFLEYLQCAWTESFTGGVGPQEGFIECTQRLVLYDLSDNPGSFSFQRHLCHTNGVSLRKKQNKTKTKTKTKKKKKKKSFVQKHLARKPSAEFFFFLPNFKSLSESKN